MTINRKQPHGQERPNPADRPSGERQARERRTGEGSASALANLRTIERDRQKARPVDDGSPSD